MLTTHTVLTKVVCGRVKNVPMALQVTVVNGSVNAPESFIMATVLKILAALHTVSVRLKLRQ